MAENKAKPSRAASKAAVVRKPRVRKVETVRERNEKAAVKAEAKSNKTRLRRTRKVAKTIAKPFGFLRVLRRPARVITWPFRTRPARFVGRILGRILWPKYFRNSFREVRQVTWPTRRDTWKLTAAVLVFAIAFGLAAAGTDWVLDKIIKRIVFRG